MFNWFKDLMNYKSYINKVNTGAILTTITLSIALSLTNQLNPILIKWIVLFFYISIIGSGLLILNNYSKKLPNLTKYSTTILGGVLILFLATLLFSSVILKYWNIFLSLTVLFSLIIQLNLLGWSKRSSSILLKLLFLLALVSNIFLISVLVFKIDFYEIKPFVIASICSSFLLFLLGVFSPNKELD